VAIVHCRHGRIHPDSDDEFVWICFGTIGADSMDAEDVEW
jgi:hypothetical protein